MVCLVGLITCGYPTLDRLDVHDGPVADGAPRVDGPVTSQVDASVNQPVDGSVDALSVDAAIEPLDCTSYCTDIQTNCTGANAQYPDMGHCTASCALFPVGNRGDTTGNTLACRLYHAGVPAMGAPNTHCVHAGPGGDRTNVAAPGTCGDACESFCILEVGACGTLDAPIPGITPQYQNRTACLSACAGFDRTHLYSIGASGNSLACRLYHVTNAAVSGLAETHCSHTNQVPTGPCSGVASP
ncbi:MAG: hypothetical protein ABIY55_00240 [Kofleriaceae bacterium]